MAYDLSPGYSGPVISFSKDGISYLVPYYENFSLQTSQNTKEPVKEAYEAISSAVLTGANTLNSTVATALGLYQEVSDLLGVKIGGESYYTLAWDGGTQSTISIKIQLHRGWANKWNAKEEISSPLKAIMKTTVPSVSEGALSAPMPAPYNVLSNYIGKEVQNATDRFGSIITTIGDITNGAGLLDVAVDAGTGAIAGLATGVGTVLKNVVESATNAMANALGQGGTATIAIGYYDKDEDKFSAFFTLSECVITSSTISYGTAMEKGSDGYTPISGMVSLELKTQKITTKGTI